MRLTVKARQLKPGDRLTVYAIGTPVAAGDWEVMDEPPHKGTGLQSVPQEDGSVRVLEVPMIWWRCKALISKRPAPGIAKAELAEWKAFFPDHNVVIDRPASAAAEIA
jgi:hypothetical protein